MRRPRPARWIAEAEALASPEGWACDGTRCRETRFPENTAPLRSLSANRNRLFSDLARRKGMSACDLWAALTRGERFVFLTITAVLQHRDSSAFPATAHYDSVADGSNCDLGCPAQSPRAECAAPASGRYAAGADCHECGECSRFYVQERGDRLLDHAVGLSAGPRSDRR